MPLLLRTVFLALILALPAGSAAAAGEGTDKGPAVGNPIPHSLAARDQHGQHRDFKSLARARGLIVLFSRSLNW